MPAFVKNFFFRKLEEKGSKPAKDPEKRYSMICDQAHFRPAEIGEIGRRARGSLLGTYEFWEKSMSQSWQLRQSSEGEPLKADVKSPSALRQPTILLVEDGPDNQLILQTMLKRFGYLVHTVDNGKQGLEHILNLGERVNEVDMILMDMQMPVMDGYTATAELRRLGYTMPIVALTAHALPGDRERCLGHGCSDYLTKPVSKDVLLRALKAWTRME